MSQEAIMAKLDAMHRDIQAIMQRVNASDTTKAQLAADALTIGQFVAELGRGGVKRSKDWVYDQIRLRRLKVLPVGKPYQLPRSEVLRIQSIAGNGRN